MLISYSICDKTALNVLIYLRAPPDSLSLCLNDALSNSFAASRRGGSLLVVLSAGGVVVLGGVAKKWGEGGLGRGGQEQESKTKQGRDRKQFKTLY